MSRLSISDPRSLGNLMEGAERARWVRRLEIHVVPGANSRNELHVDLRPRPASLAPDLARDLVRFAPGEPDGHPEASRHRGGD